ncbi:exported hypothetical protein [Candidatus Sulfotelmatobacter sp. SbA7]|nr:exported hypothetical protein [Candidatus Sulfotelmatobacter sp. SbA7]
MIRRTHLALLVFLLCPVFSLSAGKEIQSDPGWAAITERGRMLAQYDTAAWYATDAVEALKPDKSVAPMYIAKTVESGWEVAFGRLNDKRDRFLVVYQASQGAKPNEFTVKKLDPPSEDQGFYLSAAKAIETASQDFGKPGRPYNTYVLPAPKDQLYVYYLPAQTTDGVYPMGADVRYLLSEGGNSIVEKRQMHKTILEFDVQDASGKMKKIESGIHTHVLSNVPEDSDVFYVLARKPSIPEYVGTLDGKIYVILVDGTILLGK